MRISVVVAAVAGVLWCVPASAQSIVQDVTGTQREGQELQLFDPTLGMIDSVQIEGTTGLDEGIVRGNTLDWSAVSVPVSSTGFLTLDYGPVFFTTTIPVMRPTTKVTISAESALADLHNSHRWRREPVYCRHLRVGNLRTNYRSGFSNHWRNRVRAWQCLDLLAQGHLQLPQLPSRIFDVGDDAARLWSVRQTAALAVCHQRVRALVLGHLFGRVWLHERVAGAASPTGVLHEDAFLHQIIDVAPGRIL